MSQDDKTRANALVDNYKGSIYGLYTDDLCDELSKIVMLQTLTVFEVFNVLSERRYTPSRTRSSGDQLNGSHQRHKFDRVGEVTARRDFA